jgi:phage terminase small subunit
VTKVHPDELRARIAHKQAKARDALERGANAEWHRLLAQVARLERLLAARIP